MAVSVVMPSPIVQGPYYIWQNEVLVLANAHEHPELAKRRLASPGVRSLIERELSSRRASVTGIEGAITIAERELGNAKLEFSKLRSRLDVAHGFEWSEPTADGLGVHTWRVHLFKPLKLEDPFPTADVDFGIKTLVFCSAEHCALRSGSYYSTQLEIDKAIAGFRTLLAQVDGAKRRVETLETALNANRVQLAAAVARLKEPVAVSAAALRTSAPSSSALVGTSSALGVRGFVASRR